VVTKDTAVELKALGFRELTYRRQVNRKDIEFDPEIGLDSLDASKIQEKENSYIRERVLLYLQTTAHVEISRPAQGTTRGGTSQRAAYDLSLEGHRLEASRSAYRESIRLNLI
jgi:hypothetical protein